MAVDPNIKKKADDIRNKVYGKEVRESLASGLEEMSSDVVENESRQSVVEGRQDSVESQWQAVVDETTDLDVVSAPEIIAARNGESNLKARLDKENQEVTAQLARTSKNLGMSKDCFGEKKPAITFITDDGYKADINYLLPISIEKNVPFCTAIITDRVEDNISYALNADEILMLQDQYGWEILSHSASHARLSTLNKADQENELKKSKQALIDIGVKINNMVYPYGAYNEETLELTRKYYRSGRSTDFGFFGINEAPLDTYALNVIWLDSNANNPQDPSGLAINTLDYYKHYIDLAVERNGWLIVLMHSNDAESANLGGILRQTIDYAKVNNVDVLTVDKALDRFGNIIDVGNGTDINPSLSNHFKVSADGSIRSNYIFTRYEVPNAYDGESPWKKFPEYQTTINRVNTVRAIASNLPDGVGGTLITTKISSNLNKDSYVYDYQRYITLNGKSYTRSRTTGDTFTEWTGNETKRIVKANVWTALPSKEVTRITLDVPELSESDVVSLNPRSVIKKELLYTYQATDGQLLIDIYNTMTTDQSLGPTDWILKIIH